MTKSKRSKIIDTVWASIYFVLTIGIVITASLVFKNSYYTQIYVSGSSMEPTFTGDTNNADYGYVDKNDNVKKNIKRYQVVVTRYPDDPADSDYKIKRVLVLPGETFKIYENNIYIKKEGQARWNVDPIEIPFERTLPYIAKSYMNGKECTLANDEFFLAGDNWKNSVDSFQKGPIKYSSLVGVVVEMCGKCNVVKKYDEKTKSYNITLENKRAYDDGKKHYFLGVDY